MAAQTSARKTVCFDLDGTLCTNTFGEYEAAEPIAWAIDRVSALARAGHTIVIYTARGSATGIDWEQVTRAQLERWGVAYDELRFGKPSADVYVDDRAVHTESWRCGDMSAVPGFGPGPCAPALPVLPPPHFSSLAEVGRTYDGRPLDLEAHASRLVTAARAAGIPLRHAEEEIAAEARRALAAAGAVGGDLVFTIAAGAPQAAFADSWELAPTAELAVACRPLRDAVAGLRPLLAPGFPAGGRFAVAAATEPGRPAWPLLACVDGAVVDAAGGELAAVAGGRLTVATSGLRSVAGERLLALAHGLGLEVEERPVGRDRLAAAEEALVAVLPFCVLPLASIDGHAVGEAAPGPVVWRLLEAWSAEVGIELARQTSALLSDTTPSAALAGRA